MDKPLQKVKKNCSKVFFVSMESYYGDQYKKRIYIPWQVKDPCSIWDEVLCDSHIMLQIAPSWILQGTLDLL